MNKRAKILRRINRQFAPGIPEWIKDSVALVVFGVAAYVAMVFAFSLGGK